MYIAYSQDAQMPYYKRYKIVQSGSISRKQTCHRFTEKDLSSACHTVNLRAGPVISGGWKQTSCREVGCCVVYFENSKLRHGTYHFSLTYFNNEDKLINVNNICEPKSAMFASWEKYHMRRTYDWKTNSDAADGIVQLERGSQWLQQLRTPSCFHLVLNFYHLVCSRPDGRWLDLYSEH